MHVYNLYQLVHALDDHKYCTVAMVTSIGRSTSFMAVIRESLKLLSNTRNTKVVQQQPAILYDPLVRFNCRMSTTHSCIYTYYLIHDQYKHTQEVDKFPCYMLHAM